MSALPSIPSPDVSLPFPLLVEAEQLLPWLHHPQVRIIDLSRPSVFDQVHLPHAVQVTPAQLVQQEGHISGLLPDIEPLNQLVSSLGITPEHQVVVYDDEGGAWAGRFIWTLDILGFHKVSLLNGGIHAWLAHGLPTSSEIFQPEAINVHPLSLNLQPRISLEEIRQGLALPDVPFNLWDCRTVEEYTGARLAARRGGHIPKAFHFEWSSLLDRQNNLRIRPLSVIQQKLLEHGLDRRKPTVVYCQSHHRSGLPYVVGRLLNLSIRAYDGAWSEWGNRSDTPIVTGEHPV